MKRQLLLLVIIFSCKSKKIISEFNLSRDCYSSTLFNIPTCTAEEGKTELIEYSVFKMMQNYNRIVNESESQRINFFNIKNDEFKNNCLNVIVDTITRASLKKDKYKLIGCENKVIDNEENKKEAKKLSARLVYIYNPMNKNAYIDVTMNNIYAIQEAKNENGEWKPIEFADRGDWCTAQTNRNLIINPKEYLQLKTVKYKGNFKTEMRLKIKSFNNVYYSNIFIGTINKSQFNMCSYIEYKESEENPYYDIMFLNN